MTTTNGIEYTWTVPTPPEKCPCRPPCACNMSLPQYTATIKGNAQVDYVVFCEVSAQPKDWLVESQWVQRLADEQEEVLAQGGRLPAGTPKIGAILAKPPPGFGVQPVASLKAELDSLGKLRLMRGVRAYLDVNSTSTAALLAGFAELGRRKWVVDFFVPEITDSRVAGLLAQSPDTTFVVEHLGCGCDIEGIYTNATAFAAWKAAVFEMAAQKNVGCFMLGGTMASWANKGAVNASMIKPFVATAIQAFQYDRLCFEANWFFFKLEDHGRLRGVGRRPARAASRNGDDARADGQAFPDQRAPCLRHCRVNPHAAHPLRLQCSLHTRGCCSARCTPADAAMLAAALHEPRAPPRWG